MRAYPLLALLALAALVAACTTSKQVPREEFEAASKQTLSMYIVSTSDNQVYRVKSYTVVDSVFIIKRLTSEDTRFATAQMPIAMPLADVTSVEVKDSHRGVVFYGVSMAIFVGVIYFLSKAFDY